MKQQQPRNRTSKEAVAALQPEGAAPAPEGQTQASEAQPSATGTATAEDPDTAGMAPAGTVLPPANETSTAVSPSGVATAPTRNVTTGQLNYDAYCALRGWTSKAGERLPSFEGQTPELQQAWQAGADAVAGTVITQVTVDWCNRLGRALGYKETPSPETAMAIVADAQEKLIQLRELRDTTLARLKAVLPGPVDQIKDSDVLESVERFVKALVDTNDSLMEQQHANRPAVQAQRQAQRHYLVLTGSMRMPGGTRVCLRHVESYQPGGNCGVTFRGAGREIARWEPPQVTSGGKHLTHGEREQMQKDLLQALDEVFAAQAVALEAAEGA